MLPVRRHRKYAGSDVGVRQKKLAIRDAPNRSVLLERVRSVLPSAENRTRPASSQIGTALRPPPPSMTRISRPLVAFQSRAVPSAAALASRVPVGAKSTDVTPRV